jgi:hypothetical protein
MSFIPFAPFGELGESGLEFFDDFGGDVHASRFNAYPFIASTIFESRFTDFSLLL